MRLLIIEDEPKTLNSLAQGLQENGFQVDTASDGNTGFNLASENLYEAIVCDVILPEKTGLEICAELREIGVETPIILLTALGSTEEKVAGLDAGSDDYLVKPFAFSELLARIRSVIRRNQMLNAEPGVRRMLQIKNLRVDLKTKQVYREIDEIHLTQREFDLLVILMQRKGEIMSKKELLEQVWGLNFDTGTNTVEVYINYLRNKLDKHYTPKLIYTIHGQGYVIRD